MFYFKNIDLISGPISDNIFQSIQMMITSKNPYRFNFDIWHVKFEYSNLSIYIYIYINDPIESLKKKWKLCSSSIALTAYDIEDQTILDIFWKHLYSSMTYLYESNWRKVKYCKRSIDEQSSTIVYYLFFFWRDGSISS